MSKRMRNADADSTFLVSHGKFKRRSGINDYEKVYEKNFECDCKRSTLQVQVSDYKFNSYLHVTKKDKRGTNISQMTYRTDEIFQILDNADLFINAIKECDEAIVKEHGVPPGYNDKEITYETIPKSQRTMEMEKAREKREKDDILYQEFLKNKDKFIEMKKKQELKEESDNNSSEDEDEEEIEAEEASIQD